MASSSNGNVFILGSSGNVGCALVKSLSSKFPETKIMSGVRDPEGCKLDEQQFPNVTMVRADMSKPDTLRAAIPKGMDCVFINTPGDENRTQLTINAIDACKNARVNHIVIVSVMCVEHRGLRFAEQFCPIEDYAKKSGLNYTLLELPLFMDNIFMDLRSIREESKLYGPLRPDTKCNSISVCDVGECAAHILHNPSKHANKTYRLTAKPCSFQEKAHTLSNIMGCKVEYMQVPWDKYRECLTKNGVPEWQANAMLELLKDIDTNQPYTTAFHSDFRNIVGRDPHTFEQWANNMAICFKEGCNPQEPSGWHKFVEYERQGKIGGGGSFGGRQEARAGPTASSQTGLSGGYAQSGQQQFGGSGQQQFGGSGQQQFGGSGSGLQQDGSKGMGTMGGLGSQGTGYSGQGYMPQQAGMAQGAKCDEHLKGCPPGSQCATRRVGQSSRSDQPSS